MRAPEEEAETPQFIAKDFKAFIRICGMLRATKAEARSGKIERWHRSLQTECIRPGPALSVEDARRLVGEYVIHYHTVRLHRAIGYVTLVDKLAGRDAAIFTERDRKLATACEQRKARRAALRQSA